MVPPVSDVFADGSFRAPRVYPAGDPPGTSRPGPSSSNAPNARLVSFEILSMPTKTYLTALREWVARSVKLGCAKPVVGGVSEIAL